MDTKPEVVVEKAKMGPPIKCGVYHDQTGYAHLVPQIEGEMMGGHKLNPECFCSPAVSVHGKDVVVVHNVVH